VWVLTSGSFGRPPTLAGLFRRASVSGGGSWVR